jgi:hypothetical protein
VDFAAIAFDEYFKKTNSSRWFRLSPISTSIPGKTVLDALPCPVAPSRRFWLEANSLAQVAESEYREPLEAAAGEHFPPGDE